MKTAVLTGPGRMEIQERPDPGMEHDTDVLLRLAAVGICGSDIHYFRKGRINDQVIRYPFIMGHECTAFVERTGKRVSSLRPGDTVAVDPAVSCGTCSQCRMGRAHTCLNLRFLGSPGHEGCLSEFIVMPESCCFPVGAEIPPDIAVMAEPLSIALYAVSFLGAKLPRTSAVLGAGPIGLSVLSVLKAGGSRIYATEKIPERLRKAGSLGACFTGNPDKEDVVKSILKREPEGVEAVFECCGEQEALDQAVHMLRPGGILLIIGIPEIDRVSFDIGLVRRREITVQNVRRQNRCMEKAVHFLGKNLSMMETLVTHRFPLEKIQEAFECVSAYRDGVVKAVVRMDKSG